MPSSVPEFDTLVMNAPSIVIVKYVSGVPLPVVFIISSCDPRKGLAGADVAQDHGGRGIEVVLEVQLAGIRLADARATALGPTRFGIYFPVPALNLDPLFLALLDRLAIGLVEEGDECIDCHEVPSFCGRPSPATSRADYDGVHANVNMRARSRHAFKMLKK